MASGEGVRFGNPYLPKDWATAFDLTEADLITIAAPGAIQILGGDIERLYFIVAAENPSGAWYLWPYMQSAPYGISAASGTNYVLIHHASYSGMVQLPWFLHSINAGDKFHVIPARMLREGSK